MCSFNVQPLKLLLLTIFAFIFSFVNAQQKTLHYNILNKDEAIGKMIFTQNEAGSNISFKIVSDVLTKMIMSMKVHVEEMSQFQGGKLMYSVFKKLVNNKEKASHETKASGAAYQLNSDGKVNMLNKAHIAYNTMMLYYREPVNISEIYSENFQQMVKIEALENHTYKMMLPDGNYNIYHYNNNVCTRVDIHTGLFNVQMVLKK